MLTSIVLWNVFRVEHSLSVGYPLFGYPLSTWSFQPHVCLEAWLVCVLLEIVSFTIITWHIHLLLSFIELIMFPLFSFKCCPLRWQYRASTTHKKKMVTMQQYDTHSVYSRDEIFTNFTKLDTFIKIIPWISHNLNVL